MWFCILRSLTCYRITHIQVCLNGRLTFNEETRWLNNDYVKLNNQQKQTSILVLFVFTQCSTYNSISTIIWKFAYRQKYFRTCGLQASWKNSHESNEEKILPIDHDTVICYICQWIKFPGNTRPMHRFRDSLKYILRGYRHRS